MGSGHQHVLQVPQMILVGIPFWESLITGIQGLLEWENKRQQKLILWICITEQQEEKFTK